MQCVARSIGSLNPATALSYLDSIRDEIDNKLQPSISALSSDVSTLLVSTNMPLCFKRNPGWIPPSILSAWCIS